MSSKIKVILIGRHVSDLPANIEVIEQRNITWALDAQECGKQWAMLGREAYDLGAALLLQNVPGVLAVSIARSERLAVEYETTHNPKWGVIVSVPGPRSAGVVTEYITAEPSLLVKALKDANGRARVEIVSERRAEYDSESESAALISATVRLTVDPVAEFKFSHIEWM